MPKYRLARARAVVGRRRSGVRGGLASGVLSEIVGVARGGAEKGNAMHSVLFRLKRAFHCSIQVGRTLTARFGLTPSRFDLLYALKCQRSFWVAQRDLRKLLGVAPSTLSRMIEALVQRGFLARRRVEGDRKRRELAMTKLGRRALRCAYQKLVRSGLAREMIERTLVLDVRDHSQRELGLKVRAIDSTLRDKGFYWGNESLLEYPFDGLHAAPTVFCSPEKFFDSAPDLTALLVEHAYVSVEDAEAFYRAY